MKRLKLLYKSSSPTSVRPAINFRSLLLVIFICSLAFMAIHIASASTPPLVSADSLSTNLGSKSNPASSPATTDTVSTVSDPQTSTVTGGPIQTCVPSLNELPTLLSLNGLPTTLKQQIDAPKMYHIFGDDSSAVRAQIRKCGPMTNAQIEAEFTAVTRYQLTWQYQYSNVNGTCRITRASVGIHVNQTMPSWQPTASAQSGFADKWSAFNSALTSHENGHTTLDIEYAQRLLDDLNNFPPTPCTQLAQSIKQLTDTDVSELEQANDNYDSNTDHGATQGAILP